MTDTAIPNSEQLQAIRDRDAGAGPNLQMATVAWRDRRQLLALVKAQEDNQSHLLQALKVALCYFEYWTPWGERLYNEGIKLVSDIEGKPFDPVAYSSVVERMNPEAK